MQCSNCRWGTFMFDGEEDEGICRRYPPTLDTVCAASDPEEVDRARGWVQCRVWSTEYCGEWQASQAYAETHL